MQWKSTGTIMVEWMEPFVTRNTRGHRRSFCLDEKNIGYVGMRDGMPGLEDVGDSMLVDCAIQLSDRGSRISQKIEKL